MTNNNQTILSKIRSRFERNRLGELLVQKGTLSPEQLRIALKEQKDTGQNIGHVLRDLNFVTASQVRSTLFEQAAYRAIAATFTLVIGLSSFGMGASAKASPYQTKTQFTQTAMIHKASYGGGRHNTNNST